MTEQLAIDGGPPVRDRCQAVAVRQGRRSARRRGARCGARGDRQPFAVPVLRARTFGPAPPRSKQRRRRTPRRRPRRRHVERHRRVAHRARGDGCRLRRRSDRARVHVHRHGQRGRRRRRRPGVRRDRRVPQPRSRRRRERRSRSAPSPSCPCTSKAWRADMDARDGAWPSGAGCPCSRTRRSRSARRTSGASVGTIGDVGIYLVATRKDDHVRRRRRRGHQRRQPVRASGALPGPGRAVLHQPRRRARRRTRGAVRRREPAHDRDRRRHRNGAARQARRVAGRRCATNRARIADAVGDVDGPHAADASRPRGDGSSSLTWFAPSGTGEAVRARRCCTRASRARGCTTGCPCTRRRRSSSSAPLPARAGRGTAPSIRATSSTRWACARPPRTSRRVPSRCPSACSTTRPIATTSPPASLRVAAHVLGGG